MKPIRQSFTWWAFLGGEEDPRPYLEEAKRIGYAAVEMMPEEHFDLVHEVGLEIPIIVGHQSLPDGMNKPENHDR
ncbi:MAG: xylose isomerase, partial [Armatimonadota bacterium]